MPLAVGVGLNPLPIIAIILILLTPKARANGLSFVLGWIIGLVLVGGVAVTIANRTDLYASEGSSLAMWLTIGLGVLLGGLGVKSWLGRPSPDATPEPPRWMSALDTFTPLKSLGLGLLLAGANPKNLVLTLTAAAAIVESGLNRGQEVLALGVFTLVATLGIITPVVVFLTMGSRASAVLEGWRGWLVRHNATLMAIVLLVIGALMVVLALTG